MEFRTNFLRFHRNLHFGNFLIVVRLQCPSKHTNKRTLPSPVLTQHNNNFRIRKLTALNFKFKVSQSFCHRGILESSRPVKGKIIRSIGMEPSHFDRRLKLLFLTRLIPLCEQNFNLVELGPRGTGKSYAFQELSPYAILLTGPTTVANLFYNMASGKMGLVGLWDAVAFDEVADLQKMPKEKSSPEACKRIAEIAARWENEAVRSDRALEVLEGIGNTAARDLLAELAKGNPDAKFTQDAKAGLERVNRRLAIGTGK